MAQELAYVLINPYIIAKSRTGGVIARFMNRTRLNLVAARMFAPDRDLAEAYAHLIESDRDRDPLFTRLFAEYVRRWYAPDAASGRPHRVMMLLFTGDDAIEKLRAVAGRPRHEWYSGETVRDTYGDFVAGEGEAPLYFEPAVFIAPDAAHAAAALKLWGSHSTSLGGLIRCGIDVPDGNGIQNTLVLLKPDNFRAASLRVGNIIDLFSRSGLKIVAIRILRMTREQAGEFYGPVRQSLRRRCNSEVGESLDQVLQRAYGVAVPDELKRRMRRAIGDRQGDLQFERLLDYITGNGHDDPAGDAVPRGDSCLALVYQGVSAIQKIRFLLGSTDPRQAEPGSVRYEFGSDVMANAAHASDSPGSAEREMAIIDMHADTLCSWIEGYYGPIEEPANPRDFQAAGI